MKIKSAAIGAVALLTPGLAQATPLTWTLNNAVFSDGGVATGSFVWDADTQTIGDYEFSVSGGDTDTFPAVSYESASAPVNPSYQEFSDGPNTVRLYLFIRDASATPRDFYLSVANELTDAGGTVGLDFVSAFAAGECYSCAPYRPFKSGTVTAQGITGGVPEPATWALMVMGFGSLGGALRRRRSKDAIVA
ncbi:PEPxxWA-CTERM sorting domain-containing protein [Phenylobacterium sp.]|uniref:PEPxxWA-CTERM sorting domain-containing protein n=1 Tax=Phenylobacterium sp. TaxID=1871053 RepID=UPI0025D09134|nr:PEPxxWA-CTERM sorting domain-containing protein [Phenylobacterium sp.]